MTSYVWCDVCGRKIDEGEAAYVRPRTDNDVLVEQEIDFETEVWQCKECKDSYEGDEIG